jgi:quercetin dioxygenase-like cupin family protein
MRRYAFSLTAAVAALSCFSLLAQAPAASSAPARARDPGINPVVLLDRPEVRILRVEIQPGAVRTIHQHDDVRYHLFLPITSGLELTIGSAKPVSAPAGQAFFMEKGTPHGFHNTSASVGMVYEVFVRADAPTASRSDALALALALAGTAPRSK